MNAFFDQLLGLSADSDTIEAGQMAARAVLVFCVALALLRLSGKRTFGNSTPFDVVIQIILGAVLSRAVVAASPLGGTIVACVVLVLLHRLLAWAAFHNQTVGRIIKGSSYVLVENGRIHYGNLRRNNLSKRDLLQGIREAGGTDEVREVETARLERDGRISVVQKPKRPD
ncbi:DUF421 domain-containing protein [Hymenobacter busanensis]|uniref:DUF421 domain-containing protein n=1 Tax=Hymenobacter busanensis TaxID=2607656 RepID=A0A7L4ZZY1_9BACT|nr:YetF domain-containing protein [Hymenobacter busanensis]KAA9331666.1 DUF421 domain-containing protein [Hymenobacter busanensis]QHJ08818.1 DUF421 domain-containing protein [Hymenobacter busanensis]